MSARGVGWCGALVGILLVGSGAWAQEAPAPTGEAAAVIEEEAPAEEQPPPEDLGRSCLSEDQTRSFFQVDQLGPLKLSMPALTPWQLYRDRRGLRLDETRLRPLRDPIDIGYGGGAPLEFCPFYLPEVYPELNLDQFCHEVYANSLALRQRGLYNPIEIADQTAERLRDDDEFRYEQIGLAALYGWLRRDSQDWGQSATLALLHQQPRLIASALAELSIPPIAARLPQQIVEVSAGEGEIPVDLVLNTRTSYDSIADPQHLLLAAAARGLKALAVADHNRLDGAQETQRAAEELKSQGKLPQDFQVIPGEQIQTLSGSVVGLFLDARIPDGMTMERTIMLIHRQRGIALLAHPGAVGGPKLVRGLPFDGYLIQPGIFEMYRTMSILYDPRLTGKTALYASNSAFEQGAGLPYSIIQAESTDLVALREAMRTGNSWAAGGLYLPSMMVVSLKPLAFFEGLLNSYFSIHDYAEAKLMKLLGGSNVQLSTTWDQEVQRMMGLAGLPDGLRRIIERDSPLTKQPRLISISVEHSWFRITYSNPEDEWSLAATAQW